MAKLRPFFLRVRVHSSFIATCLLNLGALRGVKWLAWLLPTLSQKTLCNPGMNCHGCPWAIGACPIGVMAYGSAIHAIPLYAISFVLALTAVLGRVTCAFLCPFGLLQDVLYRVPFFKFKLPRVLRYGKYAALALLVFLFPLWLGFERSGYLQVNKPELKKAIAVEGSDEDVATKVDAVVTVVNLGPKPVEHPQIDFVYTDEAKQEIFRTKKEFHDVTVPPGETVTLPTVRIPNRLGEGLLNVSSPQSEVEQSSPYQLYYCRLCPVGTLEAMLPAYASRASDEAAGMYGLVPGHALRLCILVFFLLLMLMASRPFCRTFCPAGAIYGLFSRVALSRIELVPSACTQCGACNRVCPVDLDVTKEVGGAECIACGDCAKVCPQGGIKRKFGL
jgi:ferredoxin